MWPGALQDKVRQLQKNDAVEQATMQSLDAHTAEADSKLPGS